MKAKCCTSELVGDTYQIILHCGLLMMVTHVEMERFLNFIFVCVFLFEHGDRLCREPMFGRIKGDRVEARRWEIP